jgi:hypothetical protein
VFYTARWVLGILSVLLVSLFLIGIYSIVVWGDLTEGIISLIIVRPLSSTVFLKFSEYI